MAKKTAIFIPGFSAWDKIPYMYLPFLKRLKCFDDIYVLFDEHRGLKDDVATITKKNAGYIEENIGLDQDLYLIGHSMGGLECLDLLSNYPQIRNSIKAITTICTPIHGCTRLTEPFVKKYKAVVDMQPRSQYLNALHQNLLKIEKAPPVLNVQAGLDHLVPRGYSKLDHNENVFLVKSAMHTNVLLYKKVSQKLYDFNRYVMNDTRRDTDPLVHFKSVITLTMPAVV